MFSQQNKTAKLAWLESDSSKPLNGDDGGQVGRNLFDLYSDRRSPSSRQDHHQHHHQNYQNQQQQQRDTRIAFGPGQHQARIQSGPGGGRAANQRPGSQASFMTHSNITSDDDDNYDEEDHLQQDKGSLRKLHRRPLSAGTSTTTTTTAAAIKSCSKWPSLGSDESTTPTDCEDNTNNNQSKRSSRTLERWCRCFWRLLTIMGLLITLGVIVYFWPIDSRLEFEGRVAPFKPRPKFTGPLAINSHLDMFAEKLYENQFHAPESMAWTADKRAFFTGVEGGFILLVEPYADRWTVAARLNARSNVEDRSKSVKFTSATSSSNGGEANATGTTASSGGAGAGRPVMVPYCERDVQLYGPRAEFEPSRVKLSRCSRPLGIRLAPDGSRLYVADPLSGLYRIELAANLSQALGDRARPLHKLNRVIKLIDFAMPADDGKSNDNERERAADDGRPTRPDQVYFGDDIAVNFNAPEANGNDLIYLTDCSRRWSLRYLFWLMLENDDTGRILRFDVGQNELSLMGNIVPVNLENRAGGEGGLVTTTGGALDAAGNTQLSDERGLSFPNGLELTADKNGLLISDLNNRRILRHHLSGQRAGTTELVMWVPGYSDNIRRGLDEPDGTPTYWFACGCAVSDNKHEIAEMFNEYPSMKRLLLRWLHVFGTIVGSLGQLFDSTTLKDAGLMIDAVWLKVDPYCTHGLVAQFNEQGEILRSLHGPSFSSNYKLLSEAHQVPLLQDDLPSNGGANNSSTTTTTTSTQTTTRSQLYLGSVYYSYLGRIDLSGPEQLEAAAKSAKSVLELEAKDAFGNRVAN